MKKIPRYKYLQRWNQLKNERSSWMAHWKEISDYIKPRSGRYFIQDRNKGQKRHNNIYDNTGTRASRTLESGLMSWMTSPARPWFRLATSDPELNKIASVKLWLNDCTNLVHLIFQRSNTYRALHSMYGELGAFGTAASIIVPDFENVIHHFPLTAGEYCISTNWKGEVVTLYREFQKQVGQMVKEFGMDACSPTVQSLYNNGSLEAWVTIIHAIEPRYDRDPEKRDAKNMPWRSVYFELTGNQEHVLRESGFKRFPALCPRWAIDGGDIYGSSPAMEALGDIKQLQQEQLRKSQGIDYKVRPPLQVPTSLKNKEIDFLPSGVTYVDITGPNNGVKPLYDVNIDLQHLLMDIQDVRERINASFYADLFLMLANAEKNNMTATEVAERHEEKLLMLGPVMERLQNELLDPLIEITFDQIMEAGLMPPPPPELEGHDLNIELVSMLAQAQKAIGVNSIDRVLQHVGGVAQFKPEVLDRIDVDADVEIYADSLGIDPRIIVPLDKANEVRAQRAQMQQRAMQQEQANQAADTAQKLSNAKTEQPSALTDVTRAFSGYQ